MTILEENNEKKAKWRRKTTMILSAADLPAMPLIITRYTVFSLTSLYLSGTVYKRIVISILLELDPMCERHRTRYSHMRKIVNEGLSCICRLVCSLFGCWDIPYVYLLSAQQSANREIGVQVIKNVQRYWESCFNIIRQNGLRFRTSAYGIVLRLRLF
ncbi:hypothetical protein Bca52824_054252 [Brassica carinata]|uniref:Uncharacterized protein n=1 Tax=Brassica carinata TaxID=52824 RepID=A0A8X7R892_BRACI|nr:hypothetical protein Bca52824_054252 [Brassica carinata]